MFIVPRTYARTLSRSSSPNHPEKSRPDGAQSRSRSKPTRSSSPSSSPSLAANSSSVKFVKQGIRAQGIRLPPSPWTQAKEQPQRPNPQPVQRIKDKSAPTITKSEPSRLYRASAQSLLSATSIPIRQCPRGRPSQRLPKGDHVANFSRLLLDDVRPVKLGRSLPKSSSNSNFEALFGNMDELLEDGPVYVAAGSMDTGMLTTRSVSDDSVPSLVSPDDFTVSDTASQDSSIAFSAPERRFPSLATSEDVSQDHPLKTPMLEQDSFDFSFQTTPTSSPPSASTTPARRKPVKKARGLKSSLTASFRVLKQASPTSILARNFFDIQPSLTDDRRPPPSVDEPTAELRRYLNPTPLEHAAQFHTWQDHRHIDLKLPEESNSTFHPSIRKRGLSKSRDRKSTTSDTTAAVPRPIPGAQQPPQLRNLPLVVPLASCIPGPIKTPHASSPPIWLRDDGTPTTNHRTTIPLLYDPNSIDGRGRPSTDGLQRHREPRENRDFLRVFVVEMQMRHAGKLDDDLAKGRARLWLPAVRDGGAVKRRRPAVERLKRFDRDDEE